MTTNLSSVPAFGFEWEKCNANEVRRHHRRNHSLTVDIQAEDISYVATNIFKILGAFIPLVGVGRIFDAVFLSDEGVEVFAIIRGVMELTGLGMVAVGIDIAITIGVAVAISLDAFNEQSLTSLNN